MSSKVLCRDDDAQSCNNVPSLPAKMCSTSDVPKPSSHPSPQQLQTLLPPAQSGKGKESSLQLASVGCSCALSSDNPLSSLKTQENISLSLMVPFFPQELLIQLYFFHLNFESWEAKHALAGVQQ